MNDADFYDLMKSGRSFVGTESNIKAYLEWAAKQVCSGCGAKASDRPRDEHGRCTDVWITETLCPSCFEKECHMATTPSTPKPPKPPAPAPPTPQTPHPTPTPHPGGSTA